jgi:hypothetical protein
MPIFYIAIPLNLHACLFLLERERRMCRREKKECGRREKKRM